MIDFSTPAMNVIGILIGIEWNTIDFDSIVIFIMLIIPIHGHGRYCQVQMHDLIPLFSDL
jgi:hypothetical protein